ncbi:unnamed protein product [Effrenium voratum]|uniref:beta-N-acetylhexosaminidase n=1 Tax=Effrenium voratum TaxID=2562239 RepID=A0AA36JIV2_9DINO|nr:unnamed protein product [Effrenium voratum]
MCEIADLMWPWLGRQGKFKGRSAFLRSRSVAIIPQPKTMDLLGGEDLVLTTGAAVRVSTPSLADLAALHGVLGKAGLKVDTRADLPQFLLVREGSDNAEKYTLSVSSADKVVRIGASSSHGLFNGLMTLRQLLRRGAAGTWRLPQVQISDEPVHEWRGLMLDVSRHFFNASDVKHLLDTMALYKLNRFHWHLSDDQGWRMPVAKYPRLTQVGAFREDGHGSDARYGGFYNEDEVKDIVAYAKSLHIEVVPELDSPGHIQAAVAAYPDLGNAPAVVATQFGALEHTMKPSDQSMNFMADVISSTAHLVDSDYFHVGGDEVVTGQWSTSQAAQTFLAEHHKKRLEDIASVMTKSAVAAVNKLGRRAVVWDDAMSRDLPKDTVVMLWRSWLGVGRLAEEAASRGHAVVMCPQDRTYLDQFQSKGGASDAFGAIGGFLDLLKVYEMDFDGHGAAVLGGQGQLWTEYIEDRRNLDYKAWPRGIALAEATWSAARRPGFDDFQRRLALHLEELRTSQVNFREADGKQALPRSQVLEEKSPQATPRPPSNAVRTQEQPVHESWLRSIVEGPMLRQTAVHVRNRELKQKATKATVRKVRAALRPTHRRVVLRGFHRSKG